MPSIRKKRQCAVGLLALLWASSVLAAPLPDPADPELAANARLPALLERVKEQQKHLQTLEAQFIQHRESSMLAEPEEAKGQFSFQAPDRVRWEYTSPKGMTVLIVGEQMTTWYRDLNRADKVNVGKYSSQVLRYLGASGSLESLGQYFDVTLVQPKDKAEPFRLELVPRFARIAKRLKHMTLWIDREQYLPIRLSYTEADGDGTEYRFVGLRMNAPLPADRFALELPPSVQVRTIDLGQSQSSQ
ncbi:MAG: outer membrane lipoprotein carrier protein LolA [Acidobacteriota bacterium]